MPTSVCTRLNPWFTLTFPPHSPSKPNTQTPDEESIRLI
jgi:hypothetical protein